MSEERPFIVEELPPGQKVRIKSPALEVRPDKMWILPEGDIMDNPSLAIECSLPNSEHRIVLQISLAMLNEGLKDFGRLNLKAEKANIQ